MKRLLLVCLISTICISGMMAQKKNKTFLFEEFEKGVAYFRDGRHYDVNVNYSLFINKLVYLDPDDDTLKLLNGDMVSIVKIGSRIFQISEKDEVLEILRSEPLITVSYRGRVTDKGRKGAYGTRSQTSSIDELSSFLSSTGYKQLEADEDRWTVHKVSKTYQIAQGGKMRSFKNKKQFLKLYPKHQAELEKYIKDMSVDFDDVAQVLLLCNCAVSLEEQ